MRRTLLLGLLLVLSLIVFLRRPDPPHHNPAPSQPSLPQSTLPIATAGRPAENVDEKWLALARGFMTDAREGHCDPYRWLGDVRDQRLLQACERLASSLDDIYTRRLGLVPVGQPAETLFLFENLADFRRFVAEDPWISGAHAGYASAARGFMALYVGEQTIDAVIATLAHELTHLVHRRALGSNLPPWLSEGLADAIGDSASDVGFRPLVSEAGQGVQASRLRAAQRSGKTRPLARLVALERKDFDRDSVSFDYEQSALLVRFLLTNPDHAQAFRHYLQRLAAGETHDPNRLAEELKQDWTRLESLFYNWLGLS